MQAHFFPNVREDFPKSRDNLTSSFCVIKSMRLRN
jgi:hypothetical protein